LQLEGPALCSQFSDSPPSYILWFDENVNNSLEDRVFRITSANLIPSLLGVFANLRRATISFAMSVSQLDSRWTDVEEIKIF
jgi:hypothetical protein